MLTRHVRILEEDDALALVLQHQLRNLRIAAQRAAQVAVHPRRVLGPAARPRQFVQAAAGGAGGHAPRELRQHVEVFGRKRHHLVLERIVRDQRQRLASVVEQARCRRIRRQPGVHPLHLHPFDGARQRRDERTAMRDALALERQRLGKDRRRIDRIDQVDRTVERLLPVASFGDARHQLHQPALAAIRIADQAGIALQHALAHDRVVGAAHGMQLHAQFADGG
ncbi:Uncharacterised protein [Achromobacter xylosoxidans]|nr:Uncharacterised protein [Achromobacter xylosoxidans]